MSEVVTGGIAAAAVGACAAAVGLAFGAGYVLYRGVQWLSEQAQREMGRLEQELAAPPTHATTAEARKAFEAAYERAKARAARLPSLKGHAEQAARLLALRHSPLGSFVQDTQWKTLCQQRPSRQYFAGLVEQAASRFTQANALSVVQSLVAVAGREGFLRQRFQRRTRAAESLVLEDNDGRALVAEVAASEEGARITLDLTGFGDGSCHEVMDRVLGGLAEAGVRLDHVRRRSHYRREGVTPVAVAYSRRRPAGWQAPRPAERRETETLRRRQGESLRGRHKQ